MKIKYCFAALALILCANVAAGQNNSTLITGQLFSQSTFNHTDILKLSQNNNTFGTARSVAMGGAFTSLGADLSSLSINPAGLGMYMSNDASVTSSFSINKFDNRSSEFMGGSNSKNNFGINNFGIALNLYQGSGSLTSFTVGFGYNKLADYNSRHLVYPPDVKSTIGDVFVKQLNGIPESNVHIDRLSPSEWGAVLAYDTYFLDPDGDRSYTLNSVTHGIDIGHRARTVTKGSIGEYNISAGFNFQNKLYVGFSVGIQDIYFRQKTYYGESYYFQFPPSDTFHPAEYTVYDQYKKISGSGVNFKFGAVYRPIPALRIGAAVHTPTYASVTMDYMAYFNVKFQDNYGNSKYPYGAETPYNIYDYDYQTPTRFLTGVSYTIGDMAIIAVDYERTWYNGIRYRGDNFYKGGLNSEMKNMFKPSNTIRTGIELRPMSNIALRAGYNYSTSLAEDDYRLAPSSKYDSEVGHKYYSITAGLGTVIGSFNVDLAYAYTRTKYTDYTLYSSVYQGGADYTGKITPALDRHNVMLTVGYRF